LFLRWVKGKT